MTPDAQARFGKEDAPTSPVGDASDTSLSLQVIGNGFVAAHPLPASGKILIGRAKSADIQIDDTSISREHAVLYLTPPLRIADLGSANGTRVGEHRLAKGVQVPIAPGDVIDFGTVMAVLQRGRTSVQRKRLWVHGYFEARVDEECARGNRSGRPFAVARVRVEDRADTTAVAEILAGRAREGDTLASYGPGELELLLVDATAEDADHWLRDTAASLARRGHRVLTGFASYPRDGRAAVALIESACPGGIERTSDSQLIVIVDPAIIRLHRLIERIASSDLCALLLGETGVGKEVFADAIHAKSPRAKGPFIRINCAGLSEPLLESELFGHEKGAFTGADRAKQGLFEAAAGGTVFLDEVGELPAALQAKLLRALESRQVRRVGGVQSRPVDVRFVSATNRDLEAEMEAGRFRRDLFFRLNGISIVIPPLRERPSEIPHLSRLFLSQAARRQGRLHEPRLSTEASELLAHYPWPGNIREFRNVIERAVLLCSGDLITLEHLPVDKMAADAGSMIARRASTDGHVDEQLDPELELKRRRIIEALEKSGGNQTKAAKLLGVSRGTLLIWLETYRIPRPRKASPFSR